VRTTAEVIQRKSGYELSNYVTSGDDDVMWHRCKKGQYVIVTDNPGSSLHSDMKDTVHMVCKGNIAEHIIKLELTIYRIYI